MPLHTQIYLYFIGLVLVVSVTSGALFSFSARSTFQTEVSERLWPHLASLVGEDFDEHDALVRRVRQLHDDLDVDLTVRDLHGGVLAVAGGELPPITPAEVAAVGAGEIIRLSRPVLLVKLLIRDPRNGERLGILEASAHQRSRFFGLPQPVLTWTVAWFVVALATRPLARNIAAPLERLTEAARRLGAGDLQCRVVVPAPQPARWWRPAAGPALELRALAQAFDQMAERLGALLRGQRQLLANVSHELRSPLARIRVALELLPGRAQAEDRLRAVETDLQELDRLIDDVLTTTRLDAANLPADLDAIDARELLSQIAAHAAHDPLVAPQRVSVAQGDPITLTADRSLLKRALWNLVENAAKYGASPIVLAAADAGADIALSVSDAGPGIPPAERERVLIPFYRVDSARRPGPVSEQRAGAGLGLTLVSLVARVHGGTLTIAPAEIAHGCEAGCRVTITIPKGICD
jgi:signal transduction histidine kinase